MDIRQLNVAVAQDISYFSWCLRSPLEPWNRTPRRETREYSTSPGHVWEVRAIGRFEHLHGGGATLCITSPWSVWVA